MLGAVEETEGEEVVVEEEGDRKLIARCIPIVSVTSHRRCYPMYLETYLNLAIFHAPISI